MSEQSSTPTPEEARRALAVADRSAVVTDSDRSRLQWGTVIVAFAIALLIISLRLTTGDPAASDRVQVVGFWVSMAVYIGMIVVSMLAFRGASSAPRGFRNRYLAGFMVSMCVYLAYVALQVWMGEERGVPWAVTAVAAVAALIPGLVAARSYRTLGR
ncbi:hypothetical protein [Tsukamurella sp. PLM1]|uniref:hypothetical protein n=1 Tax=Tsukamurella sp. PLM1 TaxID=2929795 RepID=UPI0020557D38|nr:hypothetical protein [Tsukamurella sp. PLM1]BDH56276.1 hypothetical protein MTP03_12150 [Tsukamurella sp. PLM1]